MPNPEEKITDAELEVMEALWAAAGPLTLAQIKSALAEKNGDTTKTLLRRLCQKGAVAQEKQEVYYYRPLVVREELGQFRTRRLIEKLYAGSAKAMVAALVAHDQLRPQEVEELRELFPGTEVLRMDADTVSGNHEELLGRFERKRIPILVGTQMVAKGLDFENVTLVGVLAADLSLYVDNFRAAERTFSLLTQVVGRAGRGSKDGRAVIQTFTPDNEVITAAAAQDYNSFYAGEIRMRRARRYPPFADIFPLTVSGGEGGAVLRAAAGLREAMRAGLRYPTAANMAVEIVGPAPAPVVKVNNRFRYRVFWVGRNDHTTRELIAYYLRAFHQKKENRGMNLFVDCNGED